jgi:hypothetical protein
VIAAFVGAIAAAIVVALVAAVGIIVAIVMPAAAGAEHATGARVRIQPDDATLGRHPLHAIMHLAVTAHERTLGIIEASGMVATDLGKYSIQRFRTVTGGRIGAPVVVALRVSGNGRKHKECEGENPE